MRIKSVHIRGLKNLSDIKIAFGEGADATLLFANNGVGKTTILEALSLIGHVSCMRQVLAYTKSGKLAVEQRPSRLWREMGRELPADDEVFNPLKSSLETYGTLQDWFEAVPRDGRDGAAIQYVIHLSNGIKDIQLYIFVRKHSYDFGDKSPREVTITKALSRQYPDEEMDNVMAIIAERDEYGPKVNAKVDELIDRVFATRPHILKDRILPRQQKAAKASWGIVSYINTDLNDFGKGNDLRETPKDITGDFPRELIHRLEIPFLLQAEGTYRSLDFLADLNTHLKQILNKYPHFDPPGGPDSEAVFEIRECKYSEEERHLRFNAHRRGKPVDVLLDYMSAGENECFFLFLMVHGLIAENSIVLLDEPELHLSTFTQRAFFRELLSLLSHKKCQVVVATHSGVGLVSMIDNYHRVQEGERSSLQRTDRRKAIIDAKFVRENSKPRDNRGPSERDFLVDWPNSFPVHLYFHYLSTAWLCLSVATSRAFLLKVLMAPAFLFHSGYQQSDTSRRLLWTCVGVFATTLVPVIVAVISDIWNLFGKQTLAVHRVVIEVVGPFALASFGLLSFCVLYLAWRGRGQ